MISSRLHFGALINVWHAVVSGDLCGPLTSVSSLCAIADHVTGPSHIPKLQSDWRDLLPP